MAWEEKTEKSMDETQRHSPRAAESGLEKAVKAPARPASLLEAVAQGDLAVEAALAAGAGSAQAQEVDGEKRTPLMLAALAGRPRSVELLLSISDAKATDGRFRDALMFSLFDFDDEKEGREKRAAAALACVELLAPVSDTRAQSFMGVSALMAAARKGLADCVEVLLPLSDAKAKDTHGETALMKAAMAGSESCARLLMEEGDPAASNDLGNTALMLAAAAGDVATLRLLMERDEFNRLNTRGQGALEAALSGRPISEACVDELMAAWAARGEAKERAEEAIRLAARRENPAAIALLARWGNPSSRSDADISALEIAIRYANPKLVKALLDAGASATDRNPRNGHTALERMAAAGPLSPIMPNDKKALAAWSEVADALVEASEWDVAGPHGLTAAQIAKTEKKDGWEIIAESIARAQARKEAQALSDAIDAGRDGIQAPIGAETRADAPANRKPKAL
jgi:ankyrin repeat protein